MSGFTVTGLTTYVAENAENIYSAAILGAQTLKYPGISIQPGIKNAEKIMLLSNSAPFQVGGTCAFNASGTTEFSDVTLTVSPLKWNDTFCPEDLQTKFLSTKMIAGSNYDALPFEQQIMDLVTQNISGQLEQTIWQGDTDSTSNVSLKQFDGWLKKIDAGSPIEATAQASVTTGNVISIFDDVYSLIPAQLLNHPTRKMVAFCGSETFRKLVIAIKAANLFHYDASHTEMEIVMPGTGLKVVALNGLNNIATSQASYNDRIVCTYPENLFYGTDLANEYEEAKLWYSMDDQNIKGSIKWKSGTQIAYTTEVVTYKNS